MSSHRRTRSPRACGFVWKYVCCLRGAFFKLLRLSRRSQPAGNRFGLTHSHMIVRLSVPLSDLRLLLCRKLRNHAKMAGIFTLWNGLLALVGYLLAALVPFLAKKPVVRSVAVGPAKAGEHTRAPFSFRF